MTNTTDTYWEVDGTSLQTYARNIETKGGSRLGAAPLRGENIVVPTKFGRQWVAKLPDARVLSLQGWVQGCDDDGVVAAGAEQIFTDNWQALRRLFWRTDRQINLKKRWKGVDDVVRSATAKAEFAGGLEPGMMDPASAKFTVDLMLADPYFYGQAVTTTVTTAGATITPGGDDTTRKITLVFTGAGSKTLTNTTTGRSITVSGATTVDILAFTATTIGSANVDTAGEKNEQFWFSLLRDANVLTLDHDSVDITYTPVYL